MQQDYIKAIDEIRKKEYPSLCNTTYLDHGGTTLYSRSLVAQFAQDLNSNLFGNPHSASPSSALSTKRVDRVRARVLDFFSADPEHFDVVFVANATAAIKMVMYAFQDAGRAETEQTPGFWYGYHKDAHTSLVGGRQLAAASTCFKSDREVEDWLSDSETRGTASSCRLDSNQIGLFAYPAQSNMNGHRLPLNWCGRVRNPQNSAHQNIYTLLDAAAFVTTAQLDLSNAATAPDFTALSFYKIFGLPDMGALIVRRASGHILRKTRYFGGGTVDMVIAVDSAWHSKKKQEIHEQLEDGTLPFHNIIALDAALDSHARLFGSMKLISAHATFLAKLLHEKMSSMKHGNGTPVFKIYKHPDSTYGDSKTQAPTVAFNARNSQGGWIGKSEFEELAIAHGIQLRTGGLCNPGGIATCLALEPWNLRHNFAEGVRCGNDFDTLAGKPTGVVRVSLGAMSSLTDVENFIRFVEDNFVEASATIAIPLEKSFSNTGAKIQSISIFPIQGGRSWQVPPSTSWEILGGGLLWNEEWCVIDKQTGEVLTSETCPELSTLQPKVLFEQGLLTISHIGERSQTKDQVNEVSVSIWESPRPENEHDGISPRIPDAYPSCALAEFLTGAMKRPCTLARYPSRRTSQNLAPRRVLLHKAPLQESLRDSALSGCGSSLATTVPAGIFIKLPTNSDEESRANLQISEPFAVDETIQYVRIGSHYFACRQQSGHRHLLEHLPNVFDLSSSSQNPTIQVGDMVETISDSDAEEDPVLRSCIASTFSTGFICPVAWCRKELSNREAKAAHILDHGAGKIARSVDSSPIPVPDLVVWTQMGDSEVSSLAKDGRQIQVAVKSLSLKTGKGREMPAWMKMKSFRARLKLLSV